MSKRKHEAVGIIDSALGSMLAEQQRHQDAQEAPQAPGGVDFIPTKTFKGRRPGFKFQAGSQGVGYYLDPVQKGMPTDIADFAEPAFKAPKEAIDPLKLLEEAEKAEAEAGGQVDINLDSRGVKKLVLGFEKKLSMNLEMRMKHADNPSKFMDSEIDLDQEVKKLHALATAPALYPELVKVGAVPSILNLLSHENLDIAADAVAVIQELTDGDAVEDHDEAAKVLVDSLLENNGLEVIVGTLSRFDEGQADEAQAVNNILGIVENLAEIKPEVAETICEKTKLLPWLLRRAKSKEFDANRAYAAELLSILLQSSTANQLRVGEANGVDTLLQCVAAYKSRDPGGDEEQEMMENLFGALCSVVLPVENKARFVKAEGVELMILVLKGKRQARYPALKCLDFAVTQCPAACERFVDVLGLKTAFAAFMGKGRGKKGRKEDTPEEEEDDRVASLVANLFNGLSRGSRWDRLASKFVESEYEKVDRLMELLSKARRRVAAAERKLEVLTREEDLDEDEKYLERLDGGLYGLQQVALILAQVWSSGDKGIQGRVLQLLKMQGAKLKEVRAVLREYAANIGEVDGAEGKRRQVGRVLGLASGLREDDEPPSPEAREEGEEGGTGSGGGEGGGSAGGGVGPGDGEAGDQDMDVE